MSRKCKTSFYFGFYPSKDHARMLMNGNMHSSLQTLMLKKVSIDGTSTHFIHQVFIEELLCLRHCSRY